MRGFFLDVAVAAEVVAMLCATGARFNSSRNSADTAQVAAGAAKLSERSIQVFAVGGSGLASSLLRRVSCWIRAHAARASGRPISAGLSSLEPLHGVPPASLHELNPQAR